MSRGRRARNPAFATWIGGLAALLIAIGSGPSPERAAAVRRFSQVAAVSLVEVGLTGLLRAVDEVAAWDALVSTLFGQLVAVKIGLLVVLAGLGAVNRFRSVPAAERSLRGLRRVGGLEVGAAAVVLVASAMLTSLVPPSLARVAARQPPPPRVTASGTAGAVRATLEVTPGYPGLNRFTLRAYDASNRAVLGAVTLRFQMPGRPEVEASTLTLARGADGSYGGLGSNLSLFGEYAVTASVDQRPQPLEVPFQVTTTLSPAQLRQMTMGGAPMVHGLALSNGWRLEAYLTPGHEGRNTLHVNLTDRRGGPVTVNTTPAVTARRGGAAKTLSLLRLAYGTPSANQFYAAGVFTAGTWDFQVSLDAPDGVRVQARFSLTVER